MAIRRLLAIDAGIQVGALTLAALAGWEAGLLTGDSSVSGIVGRAGTFRNGASRARFRQATLSWGNLTVVANETVLYSAPSGVNLRLVRVDGDPGLCRRMIALGLRPGACLCIQQKLSGGGRLVSVANTRIALGTDILRASYVDVA